MIIDLVLVAVCIIALVAVVFLRIALNKVGAYEELLKTANETITSLTSSNDKYEIWFDEFKVRLIESYQRIKVIDQRGSFEADDEVGYFFKELKTMIERLYEMGLLDERKEDNTEQTKITNEKLQEIFSRRNTTQTPGAKIEG